jgi:hypothetical protein
VFVFVVDRIRVIARSASDEAFQTLAQAHWIVSLTLAMTRGLAEISAVRRLIACIARSAAPVSPRLCILQRRHAQRLSGPLHHTSCGSPPPFHGGGKQARSRGADAPEFLFTTTPVPGTKNARARKARGAERRKTHPANVRRAGACRTPACVRGGARHGAHCLRNASAWGALAFRRTAAALVRASTS